jgi:hypothetical protein
VRQLEHEQLERRLRRAELEVQVLSAELKASAQRVEEARAEVQGPEGSTSTDTSGIHGNKVAPPNACTHPRPQATLESPYPDGFKQPYVVNYTRPKLRASYSNIQAPAVINDLDGGSLAEAGEETVAAGYADMAHEY